MWRDICLLNRDAILDVIRRFRKTLEGLEQLIAGNNSEGIMREFEKAKNIKNSLKTNSK